MSWGNDHDHRGEYADNRHDHDNDYAEKHHQHYDLERQTEDVERRLREEIRELRADLDSAVDRIAALERQTPAALQAQRELDETLADNAAADYAWDEN